MDTTAPDSTTSLPEPVAILPPLPRAAIVQSLRAQVAAVELSDADRTRWGKLIEESVGRILEMTERLFPGPIDGTFSIDFEDASHQWITFDVVAQGEYRDYRELIFRWHDEVRRLVPGCLSEFTLSVMPQR